MQRGRLNNALLWLCHLLSLCTAESFKKEVHVHFQVLRCLTLITSLIRSIFPVIPSLHSGKQKGSSSSCHQGRLAIFRLIYGVFTPLLLYFSRTRAFNLIFPTLISFLLIEHLEVVSGWANLIDHWKPLTYLIYYELTYLPS